MTNETNAEGGLTADEWGDFYGGPLLIYGPAAKAAALHLCRILRAGNEAGHVYRHTKQDGRTRLEAARELGLSPIVAWTRDLYWPTDSFALTLQAISRSRLQIIARNGRKLQQPSLRVQLGKGTLWRVWG